MKTDEVELVGYNLVYSDLNLNLKKGQPYLYDFGLILMNALELKKGYKIRKIHQPTKDYTRVVYEKAKDEYEIQSQHQLLDDRLKALLKEYKFEEIYGAIEDRLGC